MKSLKQSLENKRELAYIRYVRFHNRCQRCGDLNYEISEETGNKIILDYYYLDNEIVVLCKDCRDF